MEPAHPFQLPGSRTLTRLEWWAIFILIAALAVVLERFLIKQPVPHHMLEQLNNGRSIHSALRGYAMDMGEDGIFPIERAPGDPATVVETSNEALELLLRKYLPTKRAFFNKASAHCNLRIYTKANRFTLLHGECEWAYVRGLRPSSPPEWPLLANAFAPDTTSYVEDRSKKGGVWGGKRAILIRVGGAAEVVETVEKNGLSYIPRPDRRSANAFEPNAQWLAGEYVKVLDPK